MTAEATIPRVERTDNGHALWIHVCSGEYVEATLPAGGSGWQWTPDGGLTPSILCHTCGTHGFWVGGETPFWRPC